MSDFLKNLIARARGEGPTIRPRLPSRFETPTQARATDDLLLEVTEKVVVDPIAVTNSVRRVDGSRGEPSPRAIADNPPEPPASDAWAPRQTPAGRPAVERPPLAASSDEPLPDRVPHTIAEEPPRPRQVSGADAKLPNRLSETHTSVREMIRERVAAPMPVAAEQPSPVPHRSAEPPRPLHARAVTPALAQPRQELAAAAAPTIEVIIGRIEVRAGAAPQPAARPAPSPVMGLDEYLRSRRRGPR